MTTSNISFRLYSRPDPQISIEAKHAEMIAHMMEVASPFGFHGAQLRNLNVKAFEDAYYTVKLPTTGIRCKGGYIARSANYQRNRSSNDDWLFYDFKSSNKFIDFRQVLMDNLPRVVQAVRPYRALLDLEDFGAAYCGGYHVSESSIDDKGYFKRNNKSYKELEEQEFKEVLEPDGVNIDGRNNIYTLGPAHFWDGLLCEKALGYGPDEVVKRLNGKAVYTGRLLDGVYIVFNDNINMSFEEYLELNSRFKSILGLR